MERTPFEKNPERLTEYFRVFQSQFDQFFDNAICIFVSDLDCINAGVF